MFLYWWPFSGVIYKTLTFWWPWAYGYFDLLVSLTFEWPWPFTFSDTEDEEADSGNESACSEKSAMSKMSVASHDTPAVKGSRRPTGKLHLTRDLTKAEDGEDEEASMDVDHMETVSLSSCLFMLYCYYIHQRHLK